MGVGWRLLWWWCLEHGREGAEQIKLTRFLTNFNSSVLNALVVLLLLLLLLLLVVVVVAVLLLVLMVVVMSLLLHYSQLVHGYM